MPLDIGGLGGKVVPFYKPRTSTPAPLDVPRWESETPDYELAWLEAMAPKMPAPGEYAEEAPIGFEKTGKLGLPSLAEWRDKAIYDKQVEDYNTQLRSQEGAQTALATSAQKSLKGFVGKSMGASSYGARITGLDSQRGSAPMGFQPAMWNALQGIFSDMEKAGLGRPGITDGWRSYAAQVDLKKKKPKLAATPGKSVHGLGYAADLDLNPQQQRFMEANAQTYGLARLSNEPWHWQLAASKRT